MKVKQLIKELQKLDQNREVIISCGDSFGDLFNPVNSFLPYLFDELEENVCLEELTPELIKQGFGEGDLGDKKTMIKAVCLWI